MHASTVAVESFAQTLALLHHEGVLVAQDLFIRDVSQYAAYRGPGKLEGSIVNWLNGPVFQLVGQRSGFSVDGRAVRVSRQGSNTVVLQRPSPRRLHAAAEGTRGGRYDGVDGGRATTARLARARSSSR